MLYWRWPKQHNHNKQEMVIIVEGVRTYNTFVCRTPFCRHRSTDSNRVCLACLFFSCLSKCSLCVCQSKKDWSQFPITLAIAIRSTSVGHNVVHSVRKVKSSSKSKLFIQCSNNTQGFTINIVDSNCLNIFFVKWNGMERNTVAHILKMAQITGITNYYKIRQFVRVVRKDSPLKLNEQCRITKAWKNKMHGNGHSTWVLIERYSLVHHLYAPVISCSGVKQSSMLHQHQHHHQQHASLTHSRGE